MLKVCVYVIYVLTSLSASGQLVGTSYAEAQKTKTAKWTFDYTETPSFASKQSNGMVQGLAVDVMKKFAEYVLKTEGIKVIYEFKGKDHSDFNGFIAADVVAGMLEGSTRSREGFCQHLRQLADASRHGVRCCSF